MNGHRPFYSPGSRADGTAGKVAGTWGQSKKSRENLPCPGPVNSPVLVASALSAGAAWLLTTDKGLLAKMRGDTRIQVADPVDFVRATRGASDEN